MVNPKLGRSKKGINMHYSVGAVIQHDGKYLLIDRVKPPFGFAAVAGHVDIGEKPEQSLVREVEEESGLKVTAFSLLLEEEVDNLCSKGIPIHYWYVYECKTEGQIKQNKEETKSIAWYSQEELKKLRLEPVWHYWFEKLGVI